jgi:hypothetical protein
MVTAAEFEAIVRRELKTRDAAKRTRLFDQAAYDAADAALIAAVMKAAGLEVADDTKKTVRRSRRAAAKNVAAAFGDEA